MATARTALEAQLEHRANAAQLLDAYRAEVLGEVHARLAALPTANDGKQIASTRERILGAIYSWQRPATPTTPTS